MHKVRRWIIACALALIGSNDKPNVKGYRAALWAGQEEPLKPKNRARDRGTGKICIVEYLCLGFPWKEDPRWEAQITLVRGWRRKTGEGKGQSRVWLAHQIPMMDNWSLRPWRVTWFRNVLPRNSVLLQESWSILYGGKWNNKLRDRKDQMLRTLELGKGPSHIQGQQDSSKGVQYRRRPAQCWAGMLTLKKTGPRLNSVSLALEEIVRKCYH